MYLSPENRWVTPVEVQTFGDRLKELEDLKIWLESRSMEVQRTRLNKYIKFFQKRKTEEDGIARVGIELDDTDEMLFILREVDEWLWIFKGFKNNPPLGYQELFKKSLGGDYLAKDDNTHARNYQFELKIASYFLQAGCKIDLSEVSDLVAYLGSWSPIYVECKRISSFKQIPKRLKELANQLKNRYKSRKTSSCHSLAVIDVTKLVNPNLGLSYGNDREEVRDGIRGLLIELSNNNDFHSVFEGDKRVLSVWLHATIPALHVFEGEPSTRFSSLHIPLVSPSSPRLSVFNDLKKVFEVT